MADKLRDIDIQFIDTAGNVFLNYNAYWGGETAAAKLTNYLKPEIATVYVGPTTNKLLIDNRIRKDPAGDIELRRIF